MKDNLKIVTHKYLQAILTYLVGSMLTLSWYAPLLIFFLYITTHNMLKILPLFKR